MIANCPASQTIYAERGEDFGIATWDLPTVTDNFDSAPTLVLIEGLEPGSNFPMSPSNVHTIVYGAYDSRGNQAENCEFTVVVQGYNGISAYYVHVHTS